MHIGLATQDERRRLRPSLPSRPAPTPFDEFASRYPLIFRAYKNKQACSLAPIADWGCECGPGWAGIVEALCIWLEPAAVRLKAAGEPVPLITQIKEKMGIFRCYVENIPKPLAREFEARKRLAERQSAIICEGCGQPGGLLSESFFVMLQRVIDRRTSLLQKQT